LELFAMTLTYLTEPKNVVIMNGYLHMQNQLEALEARLQRRLWQQLTEEVGLNQALRLWQSTSFRERLLENALATVRWPEKNSPASKKVASIKFKKQEENQEETQ
jgi:hypothetical protein